MVKRKAGLAIILMMAANLLVKVFGLLREVLLANFYGAGIHTDAYIIANNIPTVLFAAIGTALTTTFVPMYSRIRQEDGEKRANSYTLHLLGIVLMLSLVVTVLGEIFAEQVVFIFASGFKGEAFKLTVSFVRILFPSIFGIAIMNLCGGYLQSHERFTAIVLVPVLGNLTIVFALIASYITQNIYVLVWGTLFGLAAQVLFYIPWMWKSGITNGTFKGLFRDVYLLQSLPIVIPVFIGEAANEINSMVDRSLVSGLGTGSVSSLNYSYKVINMITTVIVASIVVILYPRLSKLAAEKGMKGLQKESEKSINTMFMILLPVSAAVIIFGEDIIRVIFGHGSFDTVAITKTSIALRFYALGITAIGIRDVLVKIFCALQETRIMMVNGIVCAGINIALDVILIKVMGYKGAALATALAATIGALNLLRIAWKRRIIRISRLCPNTCKCGIGVLCMVVFLIITHRALASTTEFGGRYLLICILMGVGALLIYLVSQIILRNKTVWRLIDDNTNL